MAIATKRLTAVRRGDLVLVALQGDPGKPRPALVIQADVFEAHPSMTILPITSLRIDAPLFRIDLQPAAGNGLQRASQVMVDKPQSVSRSRVGPVIGRLGADTMVAVNRALAVFIGFA